MAKPVDRTREPASVEPAAAHGSGGGEARPSKLATDPLEVLTAAPFEIIRRMREEIDRWMGNSPGGSGAPRSWSPRVDVSEKDGSWQVAVQLPGLTKDDVKVEVMPEGLLISGEQRAGYGVFRRCIALPAAAQADKAQARFEGGLLHIAMPLAEPASLRRQIPIEGTAGERPQPDRDPSRRMRTAV